MSEILRKDFLLFEREREHEQERYISDFVDDAELAAVRHLFPKTPTHSAGGGASRFEHFIIRLGKDAGSVLVSINEHVRALWNTDSGYFSSTNSSRGKKWKVEDYGTARRCQGITDRGRSAQAARGSKKIVTVDARNSEGMIRVRPIAKLRWSAKCTRVCSKRPMGEPQMLPNHSCIH